MGRYDVITATGRLTTEGVIAMPPRRFFGDLPRESDGSVSGLEVTLGRDALLFISLGDGCLKKIPIIEDYHNLY